jgi:acyl carrier protein
MVQNTMHLRAVHLAPEALLGEVGTWAAVTGSVEHRLKERESPRLKRTLDWCAWKLAAAEARLTEELNPTRFIEAAELGEMIGDFSGDIGDVEQTLAGEDHDLDPYLRKEFVPVSPASQPAAPQPAATAAKAAPKTADPRPVTELGGRSRRPPQEIERWLVDWLERKLHLRREQIDLREPFSSYGLDSVTAVDLTTDLGAWLGITVDVTLAWDYPSITAASRHLANIEVSPSKSAPLTTPDDEVMALLEQIEGLSPTEVEALLAQQRTKAPRKPSHEK